MEVSNAELCLWCLLRPPLPPTHAHTQGHYPGVMLEAGYGNEADIAGYGNEADIAGYGNEVITAGYGNEAITAGYGNEAIMHHMVSA